MSAFILNHHKTDALGDYLRQARLDRGLSIKKVSHDLNLAGKYIEALENNQPRLLPGAQYHDKILKVYFEYLQLDEDKINELKIKPAATKTKVIHLTKGGMVAWSEYLSKALIIGVVVILLAFLFWKVDAIFRPPDLRIIYPQDV